MVLELSKRDVLVILNGTAECSGFNTLIILETGRLSLILYDIMLTNYIAVPSEGE